MRSYHPNSPEAQARLIALALLADGAIDHHELETLERQQSAAHLGLSTPQIDQALHSFCEDLLQTAARSACGQLELDTQCLSSLLAEIDDPKTRLRLLRAMLAIVEADGRLTGGEAVLVNAAINCWGIDLASLHHAPAAAARHHVT